MFFITLQCYEKNIFFPTFATHRKFQQNMIQFFRTQAQSIIAVHATTPFSDTDLEKLQWLFSNAAPLKEQTLEGIFIGPRREMITPWSTNAVEIAQNLGLEGLVRMEEYFPVASEEAEHDSMLQRVYKGLNQDLFTITREAEPIRHIDDIAPTTNRKAGLESEEMNTGTRSPTKLVVNSSTARCSAFPR